MRDLKSSLAVLWLNQHFVIERKISDGNIILAAEDPPFKQPRDALANGKVIVLYPRKSFQRPGVYGLLHDFDMTYRRPKYEDADVRDNVTTSSAPLLIDLRVLPFKIQTPTPTLKMTLPCSMKQRRSISSVPTIVLLMFERCVWYAL